jgi:small subunit ribosomal protein S9
VEEKRMTGQGVTLRATGRRKTAVATVRLEEGTGQFIVNGKAMGDYFRTEQLQMVVSQPLVLSGNEKKFDIVGKVTGGGMAGQAGALRHSLARVLSKLGDDVRQVMKGAGLLTRDQRMKERKKYGQPGARKRFQFSKR